MRPPPTAPSRLPDRTAGRQQVDGRHDDLAGEQGPPRRLSPARSTASQSHCAWSSRFRSRRRTPTTGRRPAAGRSRPARRVSSMTRSASGPSLTVRQTRNGSDRVDQTGRHPFPVGPHGGRPAAGPIAVVPGVVTGGAVPPGVAGQFVVVPHRHHGVPGMESLEVGVGLVLAMTGAVVGQGQASSPGAVEARPLLPLGLRLVDVVAEVDDEVDVLLRQSGVGVEVAGGVVGAAHHPEPQPAGRAVGRRQRAGPTDGRVLAADGEAVPVGRGRTQARHRHVDGVVAVRRGPRRARGHRIGQRRIGRHRPVARGRCRGRLR